MSLKIFHQVWKGERTCKGVTQSWHKLTLQSFAIPTSAMSCRELSYDMWSYFDIWSQLHRTLNLDITLLNAFALSISGKTNIRSIFPYRGQTSSQIRILAVIHSSLSKPILLLLAHQPAGEELSLMQDFPDYRADYISKWQYVKQHHRMTAAATCLGEEVKSDTCANNVRRRSNWEKVKVGTGALFLINVVPNPTGTRARIQRPPGLESNGHQG